MNEPTETMEQPDTGNEVQTVAPYPDARTSTSILPQAGGGTCGCGGNASSSPNAPEVASSVYAIGRVEARFPNVAAEKEFAQAAGRTLPARPINKPSTLLCPSARTAIWCANCVG